MIVNFKIYKINQDRYKLVYILILIKTIKITFINITCCLNLSQKVIYGVFKI
jgi:hypothetical protein